MTKEELEKEAEEYALKQWEGNIPWSVIQKSYYDGALPREKRIAELEKENKNLESIAEYQQSSNMKRYFEIEELKKENAELKKWQKDTIKARGNEYMDWSRMKDQLTKAKDIIEKLRALYLSPVVTKDDVKRQDEILNEVEQFLKDSEVENV